MTTTLGFFAIGSWCAASAAYALPSKLRRPVVGDILTILGILAGALLIGLLWVNLGRPPMRTLGETRWWYAVAVPTLALLIGWRFQTRILAIPAMAMGVTFALINLRHPEYMDRTLMPALQSPWFVPHVVVYMLAYSALGLSSLVAVWQVGRRFLNKEVTDDSDVDVPHRLVLVGFPLLTCGLLFGALWAKEAWGHYWTWDPKETWAFLTWSAYLGYLHLRHKHPMKPWLNLVTLVVGFAVLMLCWFGVNYMPTARESVHTYTMPGR
ncbi:MAG: cytochrome c biogenesis protein CcsA [Chthonomonas sp.]|nr:cytochrome c biogenesis protein CcsA [Chthonomonas sp.]